MNMVKNIYSSVLEPLSHLIPKKTPVPALFITGCLIASISFGVCTILFRNGMYGVDIALPALVCVSFILFECGNLKEIHSEGKNIIQEFIYFSLSILTQGFYIGTIFLIYGIEDKFFLLAVFFLFFLQAGIICLDRLQHNTEERLRVFNLTGFFLILFFSVLNLVDPARKLLSGVIFTFADYDISLIELLIVPVCLLLVFAIYKSLRVIHENKVSLFLFSFSSVIFGFFVVYTGNLSFSLVSLIFYNWIYSLSVLKSLGRVSIQPFFDFLCPVLLIVSFVLEKTDIAYIMPIAVIVSMAYLVCISGTLIFLFMLRNKDLLFIKKQSAEN